MRKMFSGMGGLLNSEYKDSASDLLSRLSCGMCDAVLYDQSMGAADPEAICRTIAAHLGDEHGVKVEFYSCNDPGCRHTN